MFMRCRSLSHLDTSAIDGKASSYEADSKGCSCFMVRWRLLLRVAVYAYSTLGSGLQTTLPGLSTGILSAESREPCRLLPRQPLSHQCSNPSRLRTCQKEAASRLEIHKFEIKKRCKHLVQYSSTYTWEFSSSIAAHSKRPKRPLPNLRNVRLSSVIWTGVLTLVAHLFVIMTKGVQPVVSVCYGS
jgi:hypothetical protein